MNLYKHSHFPKLTAMRLRKAQNFNPDKIPTHSYAMAKNIDIMDVYRYRQYIDDRTMKEMRVEKADKSDKYWKGGDAQDRLEYIKQ